MSRDKLPSRPTSDEVDGAVSRLENDNYFEPVSIEHAAASFSTVCAPIFWATKKVLEELVDNNPVFYNHDARARDIRIVNDIRAAEGINPAESFWDYVRRKNQERT